MSRLRTIKPGFFLDEDLAECDPLARILFAGLWTIADREGRLEDRPKRIKVQTLPYDECDVEALIAQLHKHGLIIRYEVAGARYIAIPTWAKHQSPHIKEAPSIIPAPDEHDASTVLTPYEPPSSCLGSCLGSGDLVTEKSTPTDSHESDGANDEGFADWWTAYGKLGSRADAEHLYAFWRTKGAEAADLLTAAVTYRDHCTRTDCKMQHARTFLAKPQKGARARWYEWAEGEDHGSMDVAGDDELASVLRAGALTYGSDNGGRSAVCESDQPTRLAGRRTHDRIGVPAERLGQAN